VGGVLFSRPRQACPELAEGATLFFLAIPAILLCHSRESAESISSPLCLCAFVANHPNYNHSPEIFKICLGILQARSAAGKSTMNPQYAIRHTQYDNNRKSSILWPLHRRGLLFVLYF